MIVIDTSVLIDALPRKHAALRKILEREDKRDVMHDASQTSAAHPSAELQA